MDIFSTTGLDGVISVAGTAPEDSLQATDQSSSKGTNLQHNNGQTDCEHQQCRTRILTNPGDDGLLEPTGGRFAKSNPGLQQFLNRVFRELTERIVKKVWLSQVGRCQSSSSPFSASNC